MTAGQDWYALLGVPPAASADEIAIAVEKLSRQASALSLTMPQRARLLRDQIRAIRQDLLSGTAQRRRYDQALAGRRVPPPPAPQQWPGQQPAQQWPGQQPPAPQWPGQQPPGQPGFYRPQSAGQPAPQLAALVGRVARFLQTGWTCAACGYDALPNDKFCHKCGAKIEAPAGRPAARAGAVPGQQAPAISQPGPGGPGAFCGKCGGPIAAGNTFCTQCGAQHA